LISIWIIKMNILIVEDDSFKLKKINDYLNSNFLDLNIEIRDNVRDAIIYLRNETPNKIILDMSLPSHSAKVGKGNPLSMPSGGIEVISELSYLNKNNIPLIILTQYPEIEVENEYYSISEAGKFITEIYNIEKLSVSSYDDSNDEWTYALSKFWSL
jgi:response regulator receiver domain protein (cheY-like)